MKKDSRKGSRNQVKISLAMATFNEEQNISRCLDAAEGWVDEIIVVDGGSTDKTREVAEKYGAKVTKTTNPPIFHVNKQKAIDQCRGDWVLQLDADEVVESSLKKEILAIVKNGSGCAGYFIPRKNFFLGKWLRKTGQYPDPVIRLFKNGLGKLPCKSVHEQVEIKGKVGKLKGHLLHYPYPNFGEYLKKSNRYTSLTARELKEEGLRPSLVEFTKAYWRFEKTFWSLYLRHKGFLDGFPGFVFSLFSGLHHLSAYIKFWELSRKK